jgi:hypothetical protein
MVHTSLPTLDSGEKLPISGGPDSDRKERGGLVSAVSQLLVLYAIYVFISGWAFLDYYFRYFGVDTRWLDLSTYDVLIKGFTVLFTGSYWLGPLYFLVIVLPLIAERKFQKSIGSILFVTLVLLAILLSVYLLSRKAGETMARKDKSESTTLPSVTFRVKGSKIRYYGKLLGFRSGTYFVHGVQPIPGQTPVAGANNSSAMLELSILRTEDIDEVTIVEHK